MRDERLYFLFSEVTRIKGVGHAVAKNLERLLPAATEPGSIPRVRDLLFHLPIGILDRRFTCPLPEAPDGKVATFVVHVDEHVPPPVRRSSKPYRVICSNESGEITLVFFNVKGDYLKRTLPEGSERVISGRVEHFNYIAQMSHPDVIAPVAKLAEVQKVEPVYPLTVGLTSRRITSMVTDTLARLPELPEWIADKKPDWPSWKDALTQAHNPRDEKDLQPEHPARQRLAYDELLAGQLDLALRRMSARRQPGRKLQGSGKLTDALMKQLPFRLTEGQHAVIKEITADMASGQRMTRLLQGDVGSGKTIVALVAMLRAVEGGAQAALMVPTEIVAQQHYEVITELLHLIPSPLKGGGLRVVLLTGSVKGKARTEVLQAIADGKAHIVVGTHALFQDKVEFFDLGLAIIDEQHRFGVNQRMALSAKGEHPHLLHLTATPIPRSLTMTMYGDMDCSVLNEKPAERQPITTRAIPVSRYNDVMERLKSALDKVEKVYWICPMIDEKIIEGELTLTPEEDIAAAELRYTEFRARFGDSVGLVHGRMKIAERNTAMQDFASGKTRLLVATTVVEVGVDVRDATIIVIEKAERFGLSQLHQLRGRVGRGDKASACVLLYSDNTNEIGMKRLSVLRDSEDGFHIAEMDLALRGGGDLLGVRQSGLPKTIFADLFIHHELLMKARQQAAAELMADAALQTGRGPALQMLMQLFNKDYQRIGGSAPA
ncbi:MAG: ATP-dependent DNA helicase RecG [Alphaproteobacteria bacterium]